MNERAIRLTAQLYQVRDLMRRVLGDRYRERCLEYVAMLNLTMQRRGCGVLDAALVLGTDKECRPEINLLLATAVEMVEGIFALPKLGTTVSYRSTHPAHPGKVAEGAAVVVKYMTAETAPAPHMRPPERMLYVRGCKGPMHGEHFLIKASEVVTC